MAKQLNQMSVNLSFTADTGKAKAQLKELQNALNKVVSQPTTGLDKTLTSQIQEASNAAAELKAHLKQATNIQTGNLDFSKLNQSLKQSGHSLSEYAFKIRDIGPAGEQAFIALTRSVLNAEVPIKRANAQLTEMWTTLKNTARWQVSSSILHGFMGAVQSAYGYAQDLNESLNNIRIVTGYNTDQMSKFAEQANKAAKALSTTTTEYTNASLIYYQQGLSDAEVQQRTDITIKMANVARQSAEVVSDQMTAIWNNFYDGSKSLEHYANVMTALGAKTASSTDEIAGGLEKFAAVADTIGLSYEYAASALATITSNTRESEEVVGTALKTIFARIQGLNLGETLDDGTTLNKYSKALQTVGISIFDQTGQLKEMDAILDELGDKWGTIGKAEQVALAQTVAGVRQYTQLVALMDNWNDGSEDSFQANLTTANNSTGALQEQADIYAESWEAARDRVEASLENIYNKIIDDDFFIGILDMISNVVDGVGFLIDSLGGLSGVLSTVGVIFTKVFSKQLATSIDNMAYNTKNFFDGGKSVRKEKTNEIQKILDDFRNNDEYGSKSKDTANTVFSAQLKSQEYLIENSKKLTEIERERIQALMDQQSVLSDQALESAKQADIAQEELSDLSIKIKGYHGLSGTATINRGKKKIKVNYDEELKSIKQEAEKIGEAFTTLDKNDEQARIELENRKKVLHNKAQELAKMAKLDKEGKKDLNDYVEAAIKASETDKIRVKQAEEAAEQTEKITQNIKENTEETDKNTQAKQKAEAQEQKNNAVLEQGAQKEEKNSAATKKEGDSKEGAAADIQKQTKALKENNQELDKNTQNQNENGAAVKLSSKDFVSFAQASLSIVSAISMVSSAWDTIKDPDIEPLEKVTSSVLSLGMAIPMAWDGLKNYGTLIKKVGDSSFGASLANTALGKSIVDMTGKVGLANAGLVSFVGYLGLAIAAITAITLGVNAAVDAYNADAIAAEKATEAANNLSKASLEVVNEYDNIKNAFESYDTAKNALDQCAKGTEDWNIALNDVEQSIRNIIEEFPELSKVKNLFVFDDETGTLVINEEARQQYEEDKKKQAETGKQASYVGEINKAQAQLTSQKTDFQHSIETTNPIITGAQLSVKDFANLLIDNSKQLSALYGEEYSQEVKTILEKEYSKLGYNVNYFSTEINEFIKLAEKYRLNLNNIVDSEEAAADTIENYSKAMVANSEEVQKYDNVEDKNAALTLMASFQQAETKIAYEQFISKDKDSLWEEFKGVYDVGDKTRNDFEVEFMASVLAADEALKSLAESGKKVDKILFNIGDDFDADEAISIKEFLSTKDYSSFTKEQLNNFNDIGIAKSLNSIFNQDTELIKNFFNVESFKEAVDLFEKQINSTIENLDKVGEKLSTTPRKIYDEIIKETSLNLNQRNVLADKLQEIFNTVGQEGLTLFYTIYDSLGEKGPEIIDEIMSIDWESASPEEISSKLLELGINIDEKAVPAIQRLIELMGELGEINLAEAKSWFEQYNELSGIKIGDSISEDQKELITKENPELNEYFSKDLDEGYTLIGGEKEVNDYIKKQQYSGFEKLKEQNYNRIELLSKNFDYDQLTTEHSHEKDQLDYINAFGEGQYNESKLAEAKNQLETAGVFDDETASWITAVVQDIGDQTSTANEKIQQLKDETADIEESLSFNKFKETAEDLDLDFNLLLGDVEKLKEEYGLNEEAARNLAVANARLDRGFIDLKENAEDYKKILSNQEDPQYLDYLEKIKSSFGDIFNVDGNKITEEQIQNIVGKPEDFQAILDGNIDVINEYRDKIANSIVNTKLDDILIKIKTVWDDDDKAIENFETDIARLKEIAAEIQLNGSVNPNLEEEFISTLNNLIIAAGMTKEEVSSALAEMGIDAEVTTGFVEQTQDMVVKKIEGRVIPGTPVQAGTGEIIPYTIVEEPSFDVVPVKTYVPVPSIKITSGDGKNKSGGSIFNSTKKYGTNAPNPNLGGSGQYGGSANKAKSVSPSGATSGNKATKIKETKKTDIVERYKEVNDVLDDCIDLLNDVEKVSSRAYGKTHINGLKAQNHYLEEQIKLLQVKYKQAEQYLAIDKQALQQAASEAGLSSFTFDKFGNINNYTTQMTKMYEELHAAEAHWNAIYQNKTQAQQQKYIAEVIDPIKEKIEGLQDAISQYDETRELMEDVQNEIDDAFYQWQDNNYEILHYTLEIEIELKDMDLKRIDYYIDKMKDNFYDMAEAAKYMLDQLPVWLDQLKDYEEFYQGIKEAFNDGEESALDYVDGMASAFANGNISQLDYVNGMKEAYDAIIEILGSIHELDKAMLHYYGDTLKAANEELTIHTDHMEHLISVLGHYKDMVKLVNGEYDYDRIGTILEGQADALKQEMNVLTSNYEMLLAEKDAIYASYMNATGEKEKEMYEQQLKDVTAAVDEAHEQMLAKTQEWAETEKELLENTVAAAAKGLQNALTNNMGFDALMDSIDRLSTYQDVYLTKTNQIYETQKMMRTAQKAADATDNQASKIKLKNFMLETQSLQEKNTLSQLELEIQQAKYDMLMAQIALEDAQNAKSTVRLQRDSEGNFGYVYTANMEDISQKEQELADAENNLYNISLEAANDYGQKRLELQQQLADELIELAERRNNGEFETDALYYAERDRLISEYMNLFIAYDDQYTLAVETNTAVQKDAWVNAYQDMMLSTDELTKSTDTMLGTCENAYKKWREAMEEDGGVISDVLHNFRVETEKITSATREYGDLLENKIIPNLEKELGLVRDITGAYADQRDEINDMVDDYEDTMDDIYDDVYEETYEEGEYPEEEMPKVPVDIPKSTPKGQTKTEEEESNPNTGAYDDGTRYTTVYNKEKEEFDKAYDIYETMRTKNDGSANAKIAIKIAKENLEEARKNYMNSYDTGGYTGAWGSDGRLAVLHQKELVLNADDTKNFLAATEILRGVSQFIDLQVTSNNFAARKLTSTTLTPSGGTLEQIVTIEANFPSVQDRNEIQEAFNNLINAASQYANRKI